MKTAKIEYWEAGSYTIKPGRYAPYWFWHVRAKNGQILCHSESYNTKRACLKGIAALQVAVLHAGEPVEVK